MSISLKNESMICGGVLSTFKHISKTTKCEMVFNIFMPPSSSSSTPVLYYLSGLTCTPENFSTKCPNAFAAAAKANVAIVICDTSPRGCAIEGEEDGWDFGTGAGFYVDATTNKFSNNYNMYSYVVSELPAVIDENFNLSSSMRSIFGHSMGGHGALTIALKNPHLYTSVSAFSPVCNPSLCPWGQKAFEGYFGSVLAGADSDATNLLSKSTFDDILIDCGDADEFLKTGQLLPENFLAKAESVGQKVTYNLRPKYDHSYNFISTFVVDHIKFHASKLHAAVGKAVDYGELPEMAGKVIECQAMVARGVKDMNVEKIFVDPPKAGEVRVKVVANALCHTDIYTLDGLDPEGLFPSILGHEAGCIVESVGEGVTSVKRGDHVVPGYTPQCCAPSCIFCMSPKTNLCPAIRSTQGQGVMPDGTTRFKDKDGKKVFHFMGCSTMAEYTVLAEISCAKINEDAPLDRVCLFGCGVSTGLGAVWNTCKVEHGATVAVFGLGAVGLAVIQGAKMAGCSRIIAVDVNVKKFAAALALGATDCVDSMNLPEGKNVQQHIAGGLTKWGVDYSFDCTGIVSVMRAALECSHRGWGTSCVIGVAASGHEISTRPFQLVTGRSWKGTAFGGWKTRTDVPKLVDLYMEGELPIEHFVTHTFQGVGKTNEAVSALHSGDCLRAVVKY